MAKTFTHLTTGGGEPPFTTASLNPPNAAAIVVTVGVNGSTGAQIATPSGVKASWARIEEFQLGDWGYAVFRGTGTTTSGTLTFTSSGDTFGAEWLIDQIAADGALSFPANSDSATGTGTTASCTLAAFANAANGVYCACFHESGDGITHGTGFTELHESFAIGHTAYSQYRTDSDTSVDCTAATSGIWGIAAFEVAEAAGGNVNLFAGKFGGPFVGKL